MGVRVIYRASFVAIVAICVILMAEPKVNAAVILAGNSDSSSFSDCSNCDSATSTTLTLPTSTGNKTTLSIVSPFDFNITGPGPVYGVDLAELSLNVGNKPDLGPIAFVYTARLMFTTPSGSASQALGLSLTGNGSSGSGANESLGGFSISFTDPLLLPGVTLSNFEFVNSGANGSFSNGTWTVQGNGNSADLFLEADVTASDPVAVPEPGSSLLLGTMLVALGFLGYRRRWYRPA